MAFRTADILDCFSTAYETARQAFVSTAQSHGARVSSHLNPVGEGASGELLYMDIAELGDARGESSLIISSGTHGIEGYAGSALQIGLLRDGLTEILPHGTVCYLVHAVNPFGFSYKRRVNEDNVDLNRNFIDFSHPLPNSEDFRAFRDFADGKIAAGRVADEIDAGELYLQQAGEARYQRALTMGQYIDHTAIYYGGRESTWSNCTWRAFLNEALKEKSLAVHVDIHTGLGRYGQETLIYTRSPADPGFDLACSCFGVDRLLIPGSKLTPDISGPIPSSFQRFEQDTPVVGVAPEYGTVPLREMLSALLEENSLWQAGRRSGSTRRATIQRMMNCFCPDDPGWRADVWQQFRQRMNETVEFLKHR